MMKKRQLIFTLMVIILICLIFFEDNSLVAFGQITPPQYANSGRISGVIYYNDGETPLFLNNTTGIVEITNSTTYDLVAELYTNSSGYFITPYIPSGEYQVHIGGVSGNSIISISDFINATVVAGQVTTVNVQTSRTPID
ncbi:hypothetical protein SDC9_97635 [bioreactor metagenome]|uniref:Carboxypeptidase regulatory-like domain-containing protein n=1 Tax=bioreactor metagenome TaxID=1076179 RepID=A0A645ACI0_9ZZZZ